MTFTLEEARDLLQSRWGYQDFRKSQRAAMICIGEGDDVLAVLPTGTGKSLLYQLPALLSEGGTLVVSPLIALMKDQVDQAVARGVPAACINSAMDEDDQWDALEGFVGGSVKLLYISPERIGVKSFLKSVQRADVSIIAVDEAHAHRHGALIKTVYGSRRVEELRPGDEVVGWDHRSERLVYQPVEAILTRDGSNDTLVAVQLEDGRGFCVTADHPLYMHGVGYVPAVSIQQGDELAGSNMRYLRTELQIGEQRPPTDDALLYAQVLEGVALQEADVQSVREALAKGVAEANLFGGVLARKNGRWFLASDEPGQSNVVARSALEGITSLAGSLPDGEGWKRRTRPGGGESRLRVVSQLPRGAFGPDWSDYRRQAALREGRLGGSELQAHRRSRRPVTLRDQAEDVGLLTGSSLSRCRVVSVTHYQPDDPERPRGDERVYTLQIGGTHTYFADGVLNHNCCSQWGHQFRPDYMHIHRLIRSLSDGETRPQVLAMTATATPIVVQDVVQSLGLDAEEVTILVDDPIRHNLRYEVKDGGIDGYGNPWGIFRNIVRSMDVDRGRHLVYISSRNGAEKLASMCEEEHDEGVAVAYHAGLSGPKRTAIQDDFSNENGRTKIIAATTAFGMGVDVPNIRTVVLFGLPGSLEDYTQQIGRAGRDGMVSRTILIADQSSADWQMRLIENENPPVQHYQLVWEYLHDKLQPGETLRASRNDIAQEITGMRIVALSPDQVGVVLNRLHSIGLIERRAVEEGVPVTVDLGRLDAAIADPGKAKPQIVHVWRTFRENCVVPEQAKHPERETLIVWINKTALKEQAGLTAYYVTKALESLQPRGAVLEVGQAVTGLLVKVLKWRADLSEELPVDRIEEKRTRDFARFQRMLEFARLDTEEDRKAMLRDYFLQSVEHA